jgi:hypothetical protein
MRFINKSQARKISGVNYLGSVSVTVKHKKSIKFGELTYSLYLAPGNLSGYETCPGRTVECSKYCLNESGHNTMSMNDEMINKSRITKTRLFFENRPFFMDWMIAEIKSAKAKADKLGFKLSIRLNNTSDINPERFYIIRDNVKINIFQLFPDIQIYDYTKVFSRLQLSKKYPNYNLTYSYTGYNHKECITALSHGYKIAVVFLNVPQTFMNHDVIDGDLNDLRFKEKNPAVVGLKYKRTRNKLTTDVKFVVQ